MNNNLTRIVAAVVDTRNLTLYKTDGSTIVIPQGDTRLRAIIEVVTPQLIRQGYADVGIDPASENSYAQFEQEGSGAVKFFRVAKAKLKNLFTPVVEVAVVITTPVPVMSIGVVPVIQPIMTDKEYTQAITDWALAVSAAKPDTSLPIGTGGLAPTGVIIHTPEPKLEQTLAAISEILQHAVPVSADHFHEDNVAKQGNVVEASGQTIKDHGDDDSHEDTIIAVVDNKIIPGMEKIKSQFARAAKLGSTVGVETFLQRLASVIEQRSHSVEDLLKFLERGDLPIADDGSILIYKVLKRSKDSRHADNVYVDCHTQKVQQFVGAYVCMDPSLVDHNRNEECSNGLHVARRGYISGFGGDVCVLAKLAPEDVITVPSYDANKMRVCGYHIIAELTSEQYGRVKNNQPITNTESGKALLANAMAGQHIGKTHEVRITGHKGSGVITKELNEVAPVVPATEPVAPQEALANPSGEMGAEPIDPKAVVKQVEKEQLSRKEQAARLYADHLKDLNGVTTALADLLAFKKQAKVGWDKLGIPDPTAGKKGPPPSIFKEKKTTPSLFPKPEDFKAKAKKTKPVKQVHDVDFGDEPADRTSGMDDGDASSVTKVVKATHGEGSPRERIAKLLAIGLTSVGVAQAILTIKKQSKKSWTTLGVDEIQAAMIIKLAAS